MGRGVTRIERDGLLEVSHRCRHFGCVERLQADAAFGKGSIGFEAARIPQRARLLAADPQRLGELRDDAILELEDVLEQAVGLGFGRRFSGRRVDHARSYPQAWARSLKAPDNRKIQVQVSPEGREIRAAALHRLDDAHAVDDSQGRRGAEIVGDGFGDARREPRQLAVAADVGEVEHRDRRQLRDRFGCRAIRRRPRRLGGLGSRRRGGHRRNEAVATARDGLDVDGLGRIVPERLTQFRDGLRERVVGDGDVRPERLEEIFFGDERGLASDEIQQQVDDLGRQLDDVRVAQQPVRGRVERVGAEAVGHSGRGSIVAAAHARHGIDITMVTKTTMSTMERILN